MQPRSLAASLKYVSLNDPGLDAEHPDAEALVQKYLETYDASVLPVKEGAKLAVFELEAIGRAKSIAVTSKFAELEKANEAVALSLLSVADFWRGPVKVEHTTVNGMRRVKPEVLDALFGDVPTEGIALFNELGAVVVMGLRPRPTKGSG
jgi:hypothetical protein